MPLLLQANSAFTVIFEREDICLCKGYDSKGQYNSSVSAPQLFQQGTF